MAATVFPACASDDSKRYQTQVDDLLHEWDDADAIASRSNRLLIGNAIPGLQSVRRRAEKAELHECASAVHRWLLRWFDGRINSYLEFLGNNDAQAQQLLYSAQIAQAVFEAGYAQLSNGQAWDEQQAIQQATLQFAPTAIPTPAPITSTPVIPTSSAPTPEAMNTEGPVAYLTVSSANPVIVRNGPGTDYDSVGEITPGVSIQVWRKIKTDGYTWYQIQFVQSPTGYAWVRDDVVIIIGSVDVVPTAEPWVISPYSATVRFLPRNDYGVIALGSLLTETHQATLQWIIQGAKRVELEISTIQNVTDLGGQFDCPPGNLQTIRPNNAISKRTVLTLPRGEYVFDIPDKGYYIFNLYIVRADDSETSISRNVLVGCQKLQ